MKNNILLPKDYNPTPFLNEITTNLSRNLNDYLINSLANMLAIDYVNRVKNKFEINEYAKKCIHRLQYHLKHKVIVEEDFSSTMSLFAIAITEEKTSDDEKLHQSLDFVIDNIVIMHFSDLLPEEQKNIKTSIKLLSKTTEIKEIMNFINTDPKLFYSIVSSEYKKKGSEKEIENLLTINLHKIINHNRSINKSINNVKSLSNKITLTIGLCAASSVGLLVGGPILAACLIPVSIFSIKISGTIGDKIFNTLIKNNNTIKEKQNNLKILVQSTIQPELSISQSQEQYLKQAQTIQIKPEVEITKPLETPKELVQKVTRHK